MKISSRKSKNRKAGSARVLSCLFAFIMIILCFNVTITAHAEQKKIKVGYIEQGDFIQENHGNYTGYGIEYLEHISEFTGWEYTYILDTWENCLNKLETGEIDLVCIAQYTDERAERFLYSDIPLGYEYTILYADAESDVYFDDYEAMDNLKVGMMSGSYHSDAFEQIMDEYSLQLETVYYATEPEIMDAMDTGEVDLAAVGSLYNNPNAKAVGIYGACPFYCITGKQNQAFMDKLNAALEQIKIENSALERDLSAKYYNEGKISSTPLFTRKEQEFVDNSDVITIKLMLGSKPLSYIEDGKPAGIFVDYLNLISEKSGLKFDIQLQSSPTSMEEETEKIAEEGYLMLRAKRALQNTTVSDKLISTNTIFSTNLAYVMDREHFAEGINSNATFAITKEMGYLVELLENHSPDFEVLYYDNAIDCLEAVVDGEADVAIQDAYIVTYLLQKPKYADKLVESPGVDFYNGMCLIASEQDEMLVSVLNKTIHHITSEEYDNIVTMELLMNPY